MFNSKIRKLSWKEKFKILLETAREFFAVKGISQGAALGYYALFALIPILYLSLSVYGRIIGLEKMQQIVSDLLENMVGVQDVQSILNFVTSLNLEKGSLLMDIFGGLVLLFASSALMVSLKESIDLYMGIKLSETTRKKAILQYLIFRGVSMVLITAFSIVMILIYFVQLLIVSVGDRIIGSDNAFHWVFSTLFTSSISIGTNLLFFTIIFKFFHSGKVLWRLAFVGATFTSILIFFSQLLIKFYLSNFFFAANGGIAGSMMVIMLWVFYTSITIFLGAKFTAVYARHLGISIQR
ncbi:MAG: YhjD/YihY/BrkB family envelope integrity protein [Bacteroidota bacterium]